MQLKMLKSSIVLSFRKWYWLIPWLCVALEQTLNGRVGYSQLVRQQLLTYQNEFNT